MSLSHSIYFAILTSVKKIKNRKKSVGIFHELNFDFFKIIIPFRRGIDIFAIADSIDVINIINSLLTLFCSEGLKTGMTKKMPGIITWTEWHLVMGQT